MGRYVTDWAGPNAIVTSIKLRLGVPWYAYDTITFRGEVTAVEGDLVTLKVVGSNSLGDHVIATSTLTLGGQVTLSSKAGLSGKAAIAGIGATDFSKNSGRSELRLAAEAVLDALADAGLEPSDVDGLVTFTMDSNLETPSRGRRNRGGPEVLQSDRLRRRRRRGDRAAGGSRGRYGGVAEVVVAYRAFNERSEFRFGQVMTGLTINADSRGVEYSWSYPHGLSTPAASVAMVAQRYMHEYGATSADFGVVSVADRKHAANNPKAHFYGKPITIEDHQNSRWIAEPLRLLDCCQETDGGWPSS